MKMKLSSYGNNGKRIVLCALIFSTTAVCTLTNTGWAMLAPAQSVPAADGPALDRATDLKTVQTALESKIVRERLKALGLNDKEIDSRLSKLSDQQVHKLAKDVKTLSPGGGVIGLLELVVLVLLIIILFRAV
jgi:hypothetical protein